MFDKNVLSDAELYKLNGYFRALNYLGVGQLYLLDNPLLKRPLQKEDIKGKLVGHFGTVPGQNFIITHLNRIIKKNNLDMMIVIGPGHGGNAAAASAYLEGEYSKVYKDITEDEKGMKKFFKRFSFPGGTSSHVSPEIPGSIHEGGELGYSLAHAYGAALDNPDLIVACIVGDGEAETGPLAASWHINKIMNPIKDGIVLPILHLNGYKIANPSVLSRIPKKELRALMNGYGYKPYFVEVSSINETHERMAEVMDEIVSDIKKIKKYARRHAARPLYPMIVFKSPKGWTGPKTVDGKKIEGTFRSHQIPLAVNPKTGENVDVLESWMKSYHPEELFNENGELKMQFKSILPAPEKRLFASKHANGGSLLKELNVPDFTKYKVEADHGATTAEDMRVLGSFVRDIIKMNPKNFIGFAPDETLSNRLNNVFEETSRKWYAERYNYDEALSPDGRIIDSMLSEHICEGMLEGYILTGRHGSFDCYEAFIRIVDSMISQHAKWLKMCSELPWRKDISSLNLILTSHCWQQDHNGFTHQDPGLINHLVTKKPEIVRVYLPADANTLLSCFDHCVRSKNYVNIVVASKHPSPQWLSMEEAKEHAEAGINEWKWARTYGGGEPDVVLASSGDTPTQEALAAVSILHEWLPNLKIKYINVCDLMKLVSSEYHPHGLTDQEYDSLFTKDKPIIFAFHGYPSLVHELTYKRTNQNMHVHGYIEEGTITTAFDMRVKNRVDRYHLVMDALKYLPNKSKQMKKLEAYCEEMLEKHAKTIVETGEDIEEVTSWSFKKLK